MEQPSTLKQQPSQTAPEDEAVLIFDILKYPDDRLVVEANPVTDADFIAGTLRPLSKSLIATMLLHESLCLAASQVSVNRRMFVMRKVDGTVITAINPSFMALTADEIRLSEGSLSLPGIEDFVSRHASIVMTYTNLDGERVNEDLHDLDAVTAQHGIDHTNGILFINRLTRFQTDRMKQKLVKRQGRPYILRSPDEIA